MHSRKGRKKKTFYRDAMKRVELFLNTVKEKIKIGNSMSIHDSFYMFFLKTKAKAARLFNAKTIQAILGLDITFIFVFLALYLFGYEWNWQVLLASFGLWIVIKEIIKYLNGIAMSFGR